VPAVNTRQSTENVSVCRSGKLKPGSGGSTRVDEAIKVEPKGDIDIGETALNIAKRVTLFFVNAAAVPVHVDKISLNNDGNVVAEISNDDCSKQGTLTPESRCSIEVSVTPTSPGPWNVEVLMTHNGSGRIARAKLAGHTSGQSDQKKDNGLALANKDTGTVSFGDVDIDGGKVVRSALVSNDSPDPLTIYAIDVIAAENGLSRLEQGCAVDMELKPGESCPVTLVWTPVTRGQISTDLIIRHSGRSGFLVVPIRGTAKGGDVKSTGVDTTSSLTSHDTATAGNAGKSAASKLPPPPSADDIADAVKDMPKVSAETLSAPATAAPVAKNLRLIGTVGNRAVLIKPDGATVVVAAGDDVQLGERVIHVTAVDTKSVDILEGDKKKTLMLEAAEELVAKAAAHVKNTPDIGKSDSYASSGFGSSQAPSGNFGSPATTGGVATSPVPSNVAAAATTPNGVAR